MIRIVPPPVPAPFQLVVWLDEKDFHVEATPEESLGSIRDAVLDELGISTSGREGWQILVSRPPRGVVEDTVRVKACQHELGWVFCLLRPGASARRYDVAPTPLTTVAPSES